jgi:hypothetical protein
MKPGKGICESPYIKGGYMNKREANRRKKIKQQENATKLRLKKKIFHYIKRNRIREAGFLMERYKERYGEE